MLAHSIGSEIKKFISPIAQSSSLAATLKDDHSPSPENLRFHLKLVDQDSSQGQKRQTKKRKENQKDSKKSEQLNQGAPSNTPTLNFELSSKHQETQYPSLFSPPPQEGWIQSIQAKQKKKTELLKVFKGTRAYQEQIQERRRMKSFKKGALMDERIE